MKPKNSHVSSIAGWCRGGLLGLLVLSATGCSTKVQQLHSTDWVQNPSATQRIIADVEVYRHLRHIDPSDLPRAMHKITPEMGAAMDRLFNGRRNFTRELAAGKIAKWLIDDDGLGLEYDVEANFIPADAFTERRANCLSFTLLLHALTDYMGIAIHINEVDIPTNWGLNSSESMVFYRHVNAVQLANARRQVFDLALDQYRFDYPQRRISLEHGYAQLLSNRAIDALNADDLKRAHHLMKLALSIYGRDANLWVNYGVISEHLGDDTTAELVFRHALAIDPMTLVAVTNLARFLEEQNSWEESRQLQDVAEWIRRTNPYYHYLTAQDLISAGELQEAKAHIDSAIRLHSEDARFYAVRSRIAIADNRYRKAYSDMKKAYRLSQLPEERNAFGSKAAWIATQSNSRAKQQNARYLQDLQQGITN